MGNWPCPVRFRGKYRLDSWLSFLMGIGSRILGRRVSIHPFLVCCGVWIPFNRFCYLWFPDFQPSFAYANIYQCKLISSSFCSLIYLIIIPPISWLHLHAFPFDLLVGLSLFFTIRYVCHDHDFPTYTPISMLLCQYTVRARLAWKISVLSKRNKKKLSRAFAVNSYHARQESDSPVILMQIR